MRGDYRRQSRQNILPRIFFLQANSADLLHHGSMDNQTFEKSFTHKKKKILQVLYRLESSFYVNQVSQPFSSKLSKTITAELLMKANSSPLASVYDSLKFVDFRSLQVHNPQKTIKHQVQLRFSNMISVYMARFSLQPIDHIQQLLKQEKSRFHQRCSFSGRKSQ